MTLPSCSPGLVGEAEEDTSTMAGQFVSLEQAEKPSRRKEHLDRILEAAEEIVKERKNSECDLPAVGTAILRLQR